MAPSKSLLEYLDDRYVMVVDPHANYRDSIKRFLANYKVKKVKTVVDAEEARKELIALKVGFFVVEWMLPEQNGLEFCRMIRKKAGYENVPFLLVTTENYRSDVILASEAGIDGYLLKPFSYDIFRAKVDEIIKATQTPSQVNQLISDGQEALQNKKFADALKFYRKAVELKSYSARALCGMGQAYEGLGNDRDAEKSYYQAYVANPDYIESYGFLLDILEKKKDYETALDIATKAHELSPDNPRYTLLLAKIAFEHGKYADSETYFKKTLLLSPKLSEAYKGLGNVYFEKTEYDKAIKNYKKALDLEPADIALLNGMGLAYVKKGLIVQGTDFYKAALKIDANDWRVLFNIGYAHEKLGDEDKAISYYERALAANPEYEKAARRLYALKESA